MARDSEPVGSTVTQLPTFRLDGRVAIVTGASSGLGERFSRVLHAAGASIVIAARRADRLDSLRELLGDQRVLTVVADVTVDDDCRRIVDAAVDGFGRVDVLVNNAGVANPMRAEEEPPAHFRAVMDVNLNALFTMTQLAGRRMLEQGSGAIVNVASMLGIVASAPINQASYCASKGAVVNLTREVASQWARKGVRVNALAPGWFRSEMAASMFEDESSRAFLARNCPMARGGEPHELDGALLFLCSDASTYCTGHTIVVDGGWTAR